MGESITLGKGGRAMKASVKFWGVAIVVCMAFAVMPINGISAQEKFPTKPITIVVPWAAGGGQDSSSRAIAPQVSKILGQPLVIVNKPGAASATGHIFVQEAAPDGYTIVQTSTPLITLQYWQPSAGVSFRKFEPIVLFSYNPATLFVKSDAPWNTLKEFVDYAKANPGKVRIANSTHGGIWHFTGIALAKEAGLKITHVSTKGSAADATMVMGGQVEGMIGGPGDVLHLVKGGKLKIIATAEAERSKALPNVPTFKESGFNVVAFSYYSWLGPKGVSQERVKILYEAVKKAAETKEYRDFCENQGVTISVMGPQEFAKFLEAQDVKYKKFIEEAGIKPE